MATPRKSFPLRISKEVYDEIKSWADQEMRSTNGHIEYILKQALSNRAKSKGESDRDQGQDKTSDDSSV